METAYFICTKKDNKEYIIMGHSDNEIIGEIYNRMYYSDVFDILYIKNARVTYKNEKYVIDL